MQYPFYYGMSEDDSEETPAKEAHTAPDVEYVFDGYDIELNVKVVLNPVTKTNPS
ncbi:hypothetical protein [Chitinophaga ginsengisoli]|uniref:Uncharacterized protein n=1 Tax=Chitinophaga ginsengisoli TaxID=363837 RepID=A0A2P8GDF7_9BACT|nr:hypothetical protein [Chitinophaga ginsengisoli]PSL32023.1 hypothetical protein CLV42_104326 [Chitinophaga ginsengisoli]